MNNPTTTSNAASPRFSRGAKKALCLLLSLSAISGSSRADVRLPSIFGDHMALQADAPLPVWGWADPGERVEVAFAGQKVQAVANTSGRWDLKLAPVKANPQPQEFRVTGKNSITFSDVLVGEVWLCSGQSNMVAEKRNLVTKEVGDKRQIRFYISPQKAHLEPQEESSGKWVVAVPQPAFEIPYSAVAYYFAVEIERARKAPVGIIQSAWGGTGIEPWIDLESFERSAAYAKVAAQLQRDRLQIPAMRLKYQEQTIPMWEAKHKEWEQSNTKTTGTSTPAGAMEEEEPEKPAPKRGEPKRPIEPWLSHLRATSIFNGMVNPHVPYAIRGAAWYQGESNTQTEARSKEYAELLKLLIGGWRNKWGQGDFPFLIVQLPGFTTDRAWAEIRNSQFKALDLPNTAIAVTLDLNPTDNLHPPDKSAVGERLALLARAKAYGEQLVSTGPTFSGRKVEGAQIRVSFANTGSGLTLGEPPLAYRKKGEDPAAQTSLLGFEIAAADGAYSPAEARIDGNDVLVSSSAIPQPVHVRYAWGANPKANLYNKEGLPAGPFRTDDLPKYLQKD